MRITFAVAAALLIAQTILPQPAAVAQSGTMPTISERGRQCLCLQQRIDAARRQTDLQAAMLEEREAELAALTQEIDTLRPQINPEDLAAVESFKRLLEHQQALRNFLQREMRPELTSAIRLLNQDVAAFNGSCIGATPKSAPPDLQCSDFPLHHMTSR